MSFYEGEVSIDAANLFLESFLSALEDDSTVKSVSNCISSGLDFVEEECLEIDLYCVGDINQIIFQ